MSSRHIFLILSAALSSAWAGEPQRAPTAALVERLRNANAEGRYDAAVRLLAMGSAAEDVYPALIQVFVDDEKLDCQVAAQALYAKPGRQEDALRLGGFLSQGTTKSRAAAAWEISRIGLPAGAWVRQELLEAIRLPDKHERNFATLALGMTAAPDGDLVRAVMKVAADPGAAEPPQLNYKFPRATAAVVLGLMGAEAVNAQTLLTGLAAGSENWEHKRAAAVWALGQIDPTSARRIASGQAIDALIRTLQTGRSRIDPKIVAGVHALGQFAGKAKPVRRRGAARAAPAVHESITLAIGYLESLVGAPGPDEIARQDQRRAWNGLSAQYLMALGGIQQRIAPALLASLTAADQDARVLAARKLGSMGAAAKAALQALEAASHDPDWILRRESRMAIRRIGPSSHVYKTLGERKLQLAMHYPASWTPQDRRTVVVFFSGGHKVQPDKDGKLPPLAEERARLKLPVVNRGPGEAHTNFCDAFARRGYVCIRVEYRTRGRDGVLPGEDIADAVSALRWVKLHAGELGADPKRIVAAGGSSGAYLAASLFAFENMYFSAGDPPVSARPDAILLYSPLLDWLEVGSMSEQFLVVLGGDKDLGARISPARHWRKDSPPTLVMVGTEEPQFETVKRFAEHWRSAGAPVKLYVAEGAKHGFFATPTWVEKTDARTDQFLRSLGLAP